MNFMSIRYQKCNTETNLAGENTDTSSSYLEVGTGLVLTFHR
jgi:hypothetical protein